MLPKVISTSRKPYPILAQVKAATQQTSPRPEMPNQKCLHPGSAQIEGTYIQEAPKLKVQYAGKKG